MEMGESAVCVPKKFTVAASGISATTPTEEEGGREEEVEIRSYSFLPQPDFLLQYTAPKKRPAADISQMQQTASSA